MRRLSPTIPSLLFATLTASCGGGDSTGPAPGPTPVATVSVSPSSGMLFVGTTQQFTAAAKDAQGSPLTGRAMAWSTSDATVATVSGSGLVSAVAPGTALVRATSEGVTGQASVTVAPVPVASVDVSPATPAIEVGATVQLTATTKDTHGATLSGRVVTWLSLSTSIATVSTTGLVTGIAAGAAVVRATSEGIVGEMTVTVNPVPVAAVTLSQSAATLVPDETLALTATSKDGGGNVLADRTVTWGSSDQAVASVSPAGVVTAMAPGSATITATVESKTAQAAITVGEGGLVPTGGGTVASSDGNVEITVPAQALGVATAITVTPDATPPADPMLVAGTAFEFGPGGTQFATPVTIGIRYPANLPAGAHPERFRLHLWDGNAWAEVPGSTVDVPTRTVTGETSHFSLYGVVETPAPVASVVLSPSGSVTLELGMTLQLTVTPKDDLGNVLTGRAVSWSSGDEIVAPVSTGGLVIAAALGGPVTITADVEGVPATMTVTVVDVPTPPVVFGPSAWNAPVNSGIVTGPAAPFWGICLGSAPAPSQGTLTEVRIKHRGDKQTLQLLVFRWLGGPDFQVVQEAGTMILPASANDVVTHQATNVSILPGDYIGFSIDPASDGGVTRLSAQTGLGYCANPPTTIKPLLGNSVKMSTNWTPLIQGVISVP